MWTPEEKEEAADFCDAAAAKWLAAAGILRTGGGPDTDIVEVAREIQDTEDDARTLVKKMIDDTVD